MSITCFSLEGKVAVVTGGKGGVGKAIAITFAEAGADVVVCSRTIDDGKLQAVADQVQRLGRRSLAIQADISQKIDVENLVQRATDEFGAIDILVNNAAIYLEVPMLECSEEAWNKVMDNDLKGYYLCSQAVGKRMVERKTGNIVSIASVSSFRAFVGGGPYNIAKAGVVTLNRILALELARYNIRVNAVGPGWIKTSMSEFAWSDAETLKQVEAQIPLGRMAEPTEIANVALFLASDASSFITGQTILVNGGSFLA